MDVIIQPALPESVVTERSGTMREVLVMSAPLILSFVSFSLMGVVDSVIMGRVGTPEQGAVGLGSMLAWGLSVLFTGTITAVNTFVAQDFGARKLDRLRRHVFTALLLIPPFVAAIWAMIPLFPGMIRLIGSSPEVAPHVQVYLSIRIFSAPFVMGAFAITSFLRGLGNMRTPMIVTIVANILNAILALLLVFGLYGLPRLGVAGAALASLTAGACETLIYLIIFFSPRYHRQYRTRSWSRPTLEEIKRFLKIGVPIGGLMLFDMVAWTLFSIYASTLQPAALAAHMIIFQVMHFSFLPAVAISVTGTTLVGQYLGAQRADLAQKSAYRSIGAGVGYMLIIGSLMILLRRPLISAFNPDPAVYDVGRIIIIIAALFQPFDGIGITTSGVLRGAGDTRFPMVAMAISAVLVFIPGVYVLGKLMDWGIAGAWLAALSYVVLVAMLMGGRFLRGAWKTRVL